MATKKQSVLEKELKDLDMMSILAGGDGTPIISKNNLIDYGYSTGISVMDYAYGYEVLIKNESGELQGKRIVLGLQAGTFNVLTGATQSFKSTIGTIIAANIAYKNNGNVVHYDAEQRLVVQRAKQLSKLPDSWFEGETPRYALRSGAIGYDTLQSDITEIYKRKMQFKNVLAQDTGVVDAQGNPIILMPPTVIFLDSLSDVIAKEYDINNKKTLDGVEDLRSNTYGMTSAKTIRGVLTDVLPMLKEANILFICIAHKTSNVGMSAFQQPKKQFQYGAHDEKISGGKAVEYNASSVSSFSAEISADSRYYMDTDGFEGNTVIFEPTKASTNQSGNEKTGKGFRIVIDKVNGSVDNIRSLILLLNQKGRLKGNKAGFRVIDDKGEPISDKFTWKTVHKDFESNPETFKVFMIAAKQELEKFIAPAEDVAGQINVFDVDEILQTI